MSTLDDTFIKRLLIVPSSRYPSRGAVPESVPYSVALKAVTQDIVHVKGFKNTMAGHGKASLTKPELIMRQRAQTAFRTQHPVDWTQPVSAASTSTSQSSRPKRRTQAEILRDESGEIEGGRGMRSRTTISPLAYNRKKHMVDAYLK